LINHEITSDSIMKRHLRPRCFLLKEQWGDASAMPPSSGVPVHISLLVVGYNVSL